MTIVAGTRLGPYEVTAQIGEGGMGQVYQATDTNLKRQVAIKVLPTTVAADADRLARFQREAEVLAALNHPNIAAIYGLERSGGMTALVMELVEGEDLSQRIARGAIPLDEALPIAKQIAEALEAAHERGIIHRDLKPANIKLRPDGTVKVLDFGLAKAFDPAAQGSAAATMSPTLSVHATMAGVMLGTAAYMSPEQASGKQVDKRTDLWAFGVVLFEMLTGAQLFTGETTSHVLASVLKSDPGWSELPAQTPMAIRRLLGRCLEKDRKRRLADASDARLEIEEAVTAGNIAPTAAPTRSVSAQWALWSGWLVAVVAVMAFAMLGRRTPIPASLATPVYSSLDVPADYVLGEDDFLVQLPLHTPIVFTPDGRSLIIQAARDRKPQLFLRSLDRPDARPIAGTEGARVPFMSPDGKWVGFSTTNELRKVPIDGGEATTICSLTPGLGPNGVVWGPDGVILFGDDTARRILRVPAGGGVPVAVTEQASVTRRYVTPFFLPDGQRFLFADISAVDVRDARLMVKDLRGGDARLIVDSATDGRLLPDGELAFMRIGSLMTVQFDVARAMIVGEPIVRMRGVMQSGLRVRAGANSTGAGLFAISNEGALAVVRGDMIGGEDTRLVWITRDGRVSPAEPVSGAPTGGRLVPRISRDQSRAVVTVVTSARRELWFADWSRNLWTPCADCTADMTAFAHAWSPDGRRVLLMSAPDTMVAHTLDASARDEVLTTEASRFVQPAEWLSDGRILYLSAPIGAPTNEIKLLDAGASHGRVIGEGRAPTVSPDRRWLAYVSTQTGQANVVVQAFPGPGTRTQVSADGGTDPAWSPDGRTIYFIKLRQTNSSMMSVDIGANHALTFGTPHELFQRNMVQCSAVRCFDVASSSVGLRFLLRDDAVRRRESVTRMDLVLNWTSTRPTDH